MLTLKFKETAFFDEDRNEFVEPEAFELEFEHSLVSLSLWESKWRKPFLDNTEKTTDETLDYLRFMLVTENPPENWLELMSLENSEALSKYLTDSQTATTIKDTPQKGAVDRSVVTSEVIYAWMIIMQIDKEYEVWNLNRLLMLIRVVNEKNNPPKNLSKADARNRTRSLNQARRAKLNHGA